MSPPFRFDKVSNERMNHADTYALLITNINITNANVDLERTGRVVRGTAPPTVVSLPISNCQFVLCTRSTDGVRLKSTHNKIKKG